MVAAREMEDAFHCFEQPKPSVVKPPKKPNLNRSLKEATATDERHCAKQFKDAKHIDVGSWFENDV